MSLIKKADVKNHLSTRRRSGIHLYRPEDEPRVDGGVEEESAGAAPDSSDSVKDVLSASSPRRLGNGSGSDGVRARSSCCRN